ncbi:hypothetical protein ACEQ8H_004752 [Pleosporales sp. CAS-2024a]
MSRYQPRRALQRFTHATRPSVLALRLLSTTPARFAQKDAQDKDSLKPRSTEYSKSGSDDAAARSDAAFNPSKTSPEEAEATAEREAGGKNNSLNASPGNPDISKPNSPHAGGTGAPDKRQSGRGSAPKAGGSQSLENGSEHQMLEIYCGSAKVVHGAYRSINSINALSVKSF